MLQEAYVIKMPYIGGILSDNSYKRLNRSTRPFVKIWMGELCNKVEQLNIPKTEYYEVGVFGRFLDERRPDISNLFKVIADALKKGLGVDDKYFRMSDEGYELGHLEQELEISISIERISNE